VPIKSVKFEKLCELTSIVIEESTFHDHKIYEASSSASSGFGAENVDEVIDDLNTDMKCLGDLEPILKHPVLDPEPKVTALASLDAWKPHQTFVDKIRNRFPLADVQLLSRLGMHNYQRRMRFLVERDEEDRRDADGILDEKYAETVAGSKFQDSGLGSSISPSVPALSTYAETIMSYRNGESSVKLPPLPEEAKKGQKFSCLLCGKSLRISNNSLWK